jgi:hypothetical protein
MLFMRAKFGNYLIHGPKVDDFDIPREPDFGRNVDLPEDDGDTPVPSTDLQIETS